MAPASPLLSIGRCSAASRSFLHSRLPDGSPPAGAPPGHRLRSGGYMAAIRSGTKGKISPHDVSTLSGEPRPPDEERRPLVATGVITDMALAFTKGVLGGP